MSSHLEIKEQLTMLQQALLEFPEGALAKDIANKINLNLDERTFQRRLMKLKEMEVLRARGKGRATRYYLNETQPLFKDLDLSGESFVPLSPNGKEILRLMCRPPQKRSPVGYNRSFLEAYQPNKGHYLTGEEQEKLATLGRTPMSEKVAGTYAKEILSRLLVDFSWNSSRLEGNTYSLLDTQRLIVYGETVLGKSQADAQMILNHKDAIEFLVRSAQGIGLNRHTILNLHALLSNNLYHFQKILIDL